MNKNRFEAAAQAATKLAARHEQWVKLPVKVKLTDKGIVLTVPKDMLSQLVVDQMDGFPVEGR